MNKIILIILGLMILLVGCRKTWEATQKDKTDYAWEKYEEKDYNSSLEWFHNAVDTDPLYKDAFNGLGWSYGMLMELDSSIKYFEAGLLRAEDENLTISVESELLSGLCFVYNANGNDSLAIVRGNAFLANYTEDWTFSHDALLNYMDVLITLASSNFFISDFTESLNHVQTIRNHLNPNAATFEPNISTVVGRQILAEELESLRGILSQ